MLHSVAIHNFPPILLNQSKIIKIYHLTITLPICFELSLLLNRYKYTSNNENYPSLVRLNSGQFELKGHTYITVTQVCFDGD